MSPFVTGLLLILAGLAGLFWGYRIFRILLPIIGGIAGYLIAAALFPNSLSRARDRPRAGGRAGHLRLRRLERHGHRLRGHPGRLAGRGNRPGPQPVDLVGVAPDHRAGRRGRSGLEDPR